MSSRALVRRSGRTAAARSSSRVRRSSCRARSAEACCRRHRLTRVDSERRQSNVFDRTWQPRLWAILAGLVLIGAYVIGFIVSNTDKTEINFLFASPRTSLIWVILLSLAIGVVVGVLLSQLYGRRTRGARG